MFWSYPRGGEEGLKYGVRVYGKLFEPMGVNWTQFLQAASGFA